MLHKGKKRCHSLYKSIFIKFSQVLTLFKKIKEDAQDLSACTGSASWEQTEAGTVEIGHVFKMEMKELYTSIPKFYFQS